LPGKAEELRMMFVAARRAAQNLLRQQRFPPERDQSARVEIFRMQRPQSHDRDRMISARRIVIENSFKRFGKSGI
jgi:hypothetical protein